jgi:hypothetical protein
MNATNAARGALLILVLAACSAAPSPTPRPTADPTPDPTPVAEWATFTSERFGYAIDHPADWEAHVNPGTPILRNLRPYVGGTDVIASLESHRFQHRHGLQVASLEVDPAQTLEELTNSVHMPCGGPNHQEETTLDGEPALIRHFRCDGNHPVYIQATTIHEGRGYVLWLMTIEPPIATERPEYRHMLDSFAFTDAAATAADGS